MSLELYNKIFQQILQSNVKFMLNDKVLKEGIIKLFMFKQYFVKFNISICDKESKVLEIPYPYEIMYDEQTRTCCLSYKLSCLCNNDSHSITSFKKLVPTRAHKFHDNFITITSAESK